MKSQPKHPWCKKVAAKNQKGHAENMWNQNGRPRPPSVDGIKFFYKKLQNNTVVFHYNLAVGR